MAYVRPHTRKDSTRALGRHRRSEKKTILRSLASRGKDPEVATAVVAIAALVAVAGVGYAAVHVVSGFLTSPPMPAQSLRLAATRVSFLDTALTFSASEPVVTDLGRTARVDYSVKVANGGARPIVWDSAQQHIELGNQQIVHGVRETLRIGADKSREVTLSFDVDENEEPVALRLEIEGERVTIRLGTPEPS